MHRSPESDRPGTMSPFLLGDPAVGRAVQEALDALAAAAVPRRIWDRDHTVWRENPAEIGNRLGWLTVVDWMRARIPEIQGFAASLATDGVEDVLLLGMGGSSLAPEVFRRTFGSAPGHPRLWVLDTTSPARIRRVTDAIDPGRFHALVASKSGTTIEVRTLYAHFLELARREGGPDPGARFTAITDPGTPLDELAAEASFRHCFCNPADIGGRYSALSYFGMVPAGLLGVDLEALLDRAAAMVAACGPDRDVAANPGCVLGAVLGAAARAGRDKLTLLLPPEIESFGLWVEQLLAESTGKEGRGIVPVVDEPPLPPERIGDDRLFVAMSSGTGEAGEPEGRSRSLAVAGHPVLRITLPDPVGLGAEMFRWEFATAVAGHLLGIHPFDQPDVQASKAEAARILESLESGGALPGEAPGDPLPLLDGARPGDYVALMFFGEATPEVSEALAELRRAIQETRGVVTTLGIGPRFLHSTGQLHKGGSDRGIFLQILAEEEPLQIPGRRFGFRELLAAQAAGDLAALRARGRRAVRLAGSGEPAALRALAARLGAEESP